ncbi:alcohol dehydrogenase family protein [Ferrimonas kyonanensis]|uniref:alcohol dehydrogenase family protein n=1 Tax=Ferrimonas kyonanensis TaxID=364763 RepID=UPI0004083E1A|nr:alcohol dehydrogenase family protein [Ferrimonas kyonanensis]
MTHPSLPTTMSGVQLSGHGGLETLNYRTDLKVPSPGPNQVLIRVGAAAINNTDINTRIGWYSKSVTQATDAGGRHGFEALASQDASWAGQPLSFPRIQGADCCGRIVAVGEGVAPQRLGQRVLVRPLQSPLHAVTDDHPDCITWGSECDGAFAQFALCRASEAYRVNSRLSDAELAAIPCAYSTAENMLHRANLGAGERVLITGASGGVGSAAIELARRRNARVWAVSQPNKHASLLAMGVERVFSRDSDLLAEVGPESVQVVIDLVAGNHTATLMELLCRGGRYAIAGAIAGPLIQLDMRTLYLKDLSLLGCTVQPRVVFENLLDYLERDQLSPKIAGRFPLSQIRQAQQVFLQKRHVGKLILEPHGPQAGSGPLPE